MDKYNAQEPRTVNTINNGNITFIIYRPGARGIRRNITRSDDISRGALPRGKYHH